MNSAPPDPLIGRTLDERYIVRSRIARGGMATVYLGNDLRLQRRVAIKVMHHHLIEDDNFTRRFEQEARSAAVLSHANLVGVYDQGIDGGLPYLVMEYLPGITLRELLKQQRQLTSEQALEIAEAVLTGLAAAHAADIVHRDVKPENVLLADDGRIKIGDFGLARAVSANTASGQALLGTIAYLSPELVTRGVADARSDIYAFGIMLFEMLTGQQPFTGERAMQIAYQHANSFVPAPSTVNPEVGPDLDQFVLWCTRREAEGRPRDAGEALEAIRAIRHGAALGSTRVLPMSGTISTVTPATSVLSDLDRTALVQGRAAAPPAASSTPGPASAVERARRSGARRARRGRFVAVVLVFLVALAGGAGFWWGQGPGSLVTVPELTGQDPDAAAAALEDLTLLVTRGECSSLTVDAGLVAGSTPEAGSRVERESDIELCVSTGPRLLPVPPLNGLNVEEAKDEIARAGFVFGEVTDRVFGQGALDTVYLATDGEGTGLGDTYPEQGRINLIISAGPLPTIEEGSTVEAATQLLKDAGLKVRKALNTKEYSETVPKGAVIGMADAGKTLKVGSKVGLVISRGPELFKVPDVRGLTLPQAIDELRAAGFDPWHNRPGVLDSLFGEVTATGTDPAAGERLRAGTRVQIKFSITVVG